MGSFADQLGKSRGYDAFKNKEAEVEERSKGRAFRFWLKPESGTKIIFLDDNPPILEEHQLKINGDWKNWFTCRRVLPGESCIICDELKDKPSVVGFYTILDLTEYTNAKGEQVKNTVKLFAPKFKALQVLKRLSQKRGGLELCVFDVYRTNSDSFNVGDVFDYEEKTDWETVRKLNPDAKPFNYEELLAPRSTEDLRKILNRGTQQSVDLDDIPEDDVEF
jgi:hypothetical protein